MDTELRRLASFVNFPPTSSASACRLSRSGFYYGGHGDAVVCNECQLELGGWTTVDELFQQHRQRSAECQLSQVGGLSKPQPRNTDDIHIDGDDNLQQTRATFRHTAGSSVDTIDRSSPDFDRLRSEGVRLETFGDWPPRAASVVDTRDLAEAGLFYTGQRDRVQCAFCRGFLRNWIRGDSPRDEHRKHFPDCPFVRGLDVGNVPFVPTSRDGSLHRVPDNTVPPTLATVEAPLQLTAVRDREIGAIAAETSSSRRDADGQSGRLQPKHPEYADVSQRIASFRDRQVGRGQTADGLAEAGYFHVGPDDNVRCFQCDGRLKNWRPTDDPWTEHARWFPRCPFVLANKDREFIRNSFPTSASVSQLNRARPFGNDTGKEAVSHAERRSAGESDADAHSDDSMTLLEDNRQLKEARTCKVCMDREVNTVFLPCGHLVCCSNCSPALRNCAICRALIRGTVKIFLN